MTIDNNKHIQLLQLELNYQINMFKKLLNTHAAKLFVDQMLYLCRFEGFDEKRGNLIVRFDHKVCNAPRQNEVLQCIFSNFQNASVQGWGGMTYKQIKSAYITQFESKTVFFKYENDHTIVGLSGIKSEDVSKYKKNALIFLGPKEPPLEYLLNLINYLKSESSKSNDFLKLDIDGNSTWSPKPIKNDNQIIERLLSDFENTDTIIIQGPPGTGKTYLMAKFCSELLEKDKKILVTALTNRALIELAEKEFLKRPLKEGKVYKTSLTASESKNKKVAGLLSLKSMSQQQPELLLSTYYIMSQLATSAIQGKYFDYIIIEEASQAFLSTLAIAKKIGKKCIIIGDIKQLEPIISKEYAADNPHLYQWMVCGLKTISLYYNRAVKYILTDSFRLTENAVKATNSFYDGLLTSKSDHFLPLDFEEYPLLNKHFDNLGGVTLLKIDTPDGLRTSRQTNELLSNLVNEIKQYNKESEIAIITFNRATVAEIQKKVLHRFPDSENLIVETIDRIQGLTTDFCIFYITRDSIPFSIQPNRFNVATSRARLCTLILADESIELFTKQNTELSTFFNRIKKLN